MNTLQLFYIHFKIHFRRHRAKSENPVYHVQADSVKLNETALTAILESSVNKLGIVLALLEDSTIRLLIDEIEPIRQRFHPAIALNGEPKPQKLYH